MGSPECITYMSVAEHLFATDESFRTEMKDLLASDCDSVAFAEVLGRRLPKRDAEALRHEFTELPHWLGRTMISHWAMAEAAGKRFELRSVPPKDVLSAARDRRVELSVAVDEEAVVLTLSHVPHRHAAWYAAPIPVATAS